MVPKTDYVNYTQTYHLKPKIGENQIDFCDFNNSFDNHYEPTNRSVQLAKKFVPEQIECLSYHFCWLERT